MHVHEALRQRGSTRAFLRDPVPRAAVERVLAAAAFAPSGSNIQPWRVHVVTGRARDALCAEVTAAAASGPEPPWPYFYYPQQWREPYLARRRACGWGLYSLLGIQRGDRANADAQRLRNFALFDAPVGLFFYLDADLELGSWLDCGMFVQSVMLAALDEGLATCPQAAWLPFHEIVARHVGAEPEQRLVTGMALGWPDRDAPVNGYRPAREPVASFTTFHDGGATA